MPPVGTSLTAFSSDTDAASYDTASITPSPNRLVLAWILNDILGGAANTPMLTGNGLTWVAVDSFLLAIDNTLRISLFRAMGAAPSAGAVHLDFAGQSQDLCICLISEFNLVSTVGANGAGAIRQVAHAEGSGTIASVTLAGFGSSLNATAAGIIIGATSVMSPGTGFSQLNQIGTSVTPRRGMSEWRNDNDTVPDGTWTGSAAWAIIGVEIVAGDTLAINPIPDAATNVEGPVSVDLGIGPYDAVTDVQVPIALTGGQSHAVFVRPMRRGRGR